mmetsp:Transcript_3402/g.6694  ORF Transcript_3402/g.6694 Transcript_3402/m.6694 type:complete len:221 (+) Transcript_3402:463-1125(+)
MGKRKAERREQRKIIHLRLPLLLPLPLRSTKGKGRERKSMNLGLQRKLLLFTRVPFTRVERKRKVQNMVTMAMVQRRRRKKRWRRKVLADAPLSPLSSLPPKKQQASASLREDEPPSLRPLQWRSCAAVVDSPAPLPLIFSTPLWRRRRKRWRARKRRIEEEGGETRASVNQPAWMRLVRRKRRRWMPKRRVLPLPKRGGVFTCSALSKNQRVRKRTRWK